MFTKFAALVAAVSLLAPHAHLDGTPVPPIAPPALLRYRPPVDRPVASGFDVANGPYGVGNRGLDYAVHPGDAVVAIGDGAVVYAGSVAGTVWVTILHADGLRSSYGPLATVAAPVAVGVRVTAGAPIGTTGPTFHLGVRRGETYVDPAALFVVRRRFARLVPVAPVVATAKPSAGVRGPGRPPATLSLRRARSAASAERSHDRRRLIPHPWRVPGRFFESAAPWVTNRREVHPHGRSRHHEAAHRRRGPLRAPDPSLEPEDATVHPR